MSDFEKIINDMLADGATAKEVGEQFQSAIHQALNNKAEQDKTDWLKTAEEAFFTQWKEKGLDIDPQPIINLLVSVYSKKHPDWTLQNIKDCAESLKMTLSAMEKMVGKDPSSTAWFSSLPNELRDIINKARIKNKKQEPKEAPHIEFVDEYDFEDILNDIKRLFWS